MLSQTSSTSRKRSLTGSRKISSKSAFEVMPEICTGPRLRARSPFSKRECDDEVCRPQLAIACEAGSIIAAANYRVTAR